MRAFVTGCAGFIGSHVTQALLERGDEVIGVDCFNDNYGRAQKLANLRAAGDWNAFEFVPIDLAGGDLEDLVEGCDHVFHLAAEPGVRSGWGPRYERYVRNNLLATQRVLEALRHLGGVHLVYASSSSVYGAGGPGDGQLRPLSPYGQTKLGAEQLCDLYREAYGVDTRSLRLFTVYGPRQRPDMAFSAFCRAIVEGRAVTILGDGLQTRDFTYVADAVGAILAAADLAPAEDNVFDIGGGSPASITEVIELLGSLSGEAPPVDRLPAEPGEPRDTVADTALATERLGYRARTSLADGLAAQLAWTRAAADEFHPIRRS